MIKELKSKDALFLLSAVHEFCSEAFRQSKDFDSAKKEISLGLSLNISNTSTDYFLLKRQSIINEIHQHGFDSDLNPKFETLLNEAIVRRHFESQRELLLHKALVLSDSQKMTQLFWQTRSPALKSRILKLAKEKSIYVNQDFYVFEKNSSAAKSKTKKAAKDLQSQLKTNQKTTRLFYALMNEAFKPQFVTDLFNEIYPEEHYIPIYSKEKIHQLVFQLRKIIETHEWPLVLSFNKSQGFHFKLLNAIQLQDASRVRSTELLVLQSAKKNKKEFTFKELCELFQCSPRTMNRKIQKLLASSEIEKVGSTTAVRYHLKRY